MIFSPVKFSQFLPQISASQIESNYQKEITIDEDFKHLLLKSIWYKHSQS